MSDLQCAATLVVTHHAKAAFVETSLSDEGGSLTAGGRAQARALADSLQGRRVAAIYSSDLLPAVQTAEMVATRLGVVVTACTSLRDVSVGSPEGDADVLGRHRDEFEQIADLHRGETVLVVGHRTALGIVVPGLARNITPAWTRDRHLGDADSVELDRDDDGWLLRRWGSQTIA